MFRHTFRAFYSGISIALLVILILQFRLEHKKMNNVCDINL